MGLLRMYEEWVSWESLSRIEVPKIRVYTRKSPEKEESIRNAVRRNPEVFFHRSPLVVTRSAESGRLFLGDGADRLKIAIEERVPRVMLSIEEYETDSEAYEAAQDDSYRMNEDRGDVVAYSVVELIRERHQKGMTVKEIAERYDKSESHIRNILAVARDEELMRLLKEEKITLYDAIRAAHDPELKREILNKTIIISAEPEKPKIEEISAKGAIVGEIKPSSAFFEEISAKKPRFEEIFDEAVERVEARLQRPMNATLKSQMRDALRGLGLSSLDDVEHILLNAESSWGGEKSDVVKKAVWIWRRRVDELESPAMWGSISFEEVLEEAREAAEEERARRAEREAYWGPRPRAGRPAAVRAEPKPKPKAEEGVEEAVGEAPESGPAPAALVEVGRAAEAGALEEGLKELDSRIIERAMEETALVLWASFGAGAVGSPGSPWRVVKDERLYDMYREAGELGTRMVVEKSIERIRKVLVAEKGGKGWPLYRRFDDPRVRDEVVKIILETYSRCRDEIIAMRDRLRGEAWDALARTLRDATPFPLGDGRVLLLTDRLDAIIARRGEEGYIRIEGRDGRILGYRRLSEILATLTGENTRIVKRYEVPVKVRQFVISPKSLPGVEDPERVEIVVLQCPSCYEVMRDALMGLPLVCGCGYPAKQHRLYESRPRQG